MASRGAKPKLAQLRLVDGTHRIHRHGDRDAVRNDPASAIFGRLVKPAGLKGEAAKIWKQLIDPAWWLDASRFGVAVAFCELWEEFRFNPKGFPASKHGQMRQLQAELGLTDERNRGDPRNAPKAEDEHFDD